MATSNRQSADELPMGKERSRQNLTGGSRKGIPNRTTALLKDAILTAATNAGGKEGLVGYLTTQATENPTSFLPLLGKVLPLQVTDGDGGPIQVIIQRFSDGGA